jgi:hypothetical protein
MEQSGRNRLADVQATKPPKQVKPLQGGVSEA